MCPEGDESLSASPTGPDRTVQDIRSAILAAVGGRETYTKLSKETIARLLARLRWGDANDVDRLDWQRMRGIALRRKVAAEVGFEFTPENRSPVFTKAELLQIEAALDEDGETA